jgi:hypothetical protein
MSVPTMIESSRSHTAAGAFGSIGGALTGATNATPIVVTTTSAHGLAVGDSVQVSGVTTNTGANGLFTVSNVGSPTTFTLGGSVGNGVAGLGGATLSEAWDISSLTTQDWTLKIRIESLTAAKKCVVAVQDSVDGFVADIVTRMLVAVQGAVLSTPTFSSKDYTNRKYDTPGTRFGVANARLRLIVLQIDAAATLVLSSWYELA